MTISILLSQQVEAVWDHSTNRGKPAALNKSPCVDVLIVAEGNRAFVGRIKPRPIRA
jgi:hypothetical protein